MLYNLIKHIIAAEANAEIYRRLDQLKDSFDSQVKHIMTPVDRTVSPKECTEWQSVEIPQEVEKFLRERNRDHFGQAQGTFPTVPPFSEHVDWAAGTYESEMILEGDYDTDTLEEAGRLMVEHMRKTTWRDTQ